MMKTTNKYSPEVRERVVRMVLDGAGQHQSGWSAILSISANTGCAPQTRNEWVKKVEVDTGQRRGVTTQLAEKMKALEREVRELKQANENLRKASAYLAPPPSPQAATAAQAELVLCKSWLLRQKGAAAQHRKLRGSGGGGVVRSLVLWDRGRV